MVAVAFYAFFVVGGRLDTLPLNLFRVASVSRRSCWRG
jgi:hypothetical protein